MTRLSKALRVHPAASLFPEMNASEFASLKADIRDRGLMVPISLSADGRIIDGRHRYKACRELKIEPTCVRNKGYDNEAIIAAAIVSLNLKRRHLDESQRAMVAARLRAIFSKENASPAKKEEGGDSSANLRSEKGKASEKAAAALNVSARSVEHAAKVLASAAEELISAVDTGVVAVSAAASLAKLPEAIQRRITKMVVEGKAKNVRLAMRAERNREQVATIAAMDAATGEYPVVVVDPPWRFAKTRPDDDTQRGQTPYPTMSEEEIAAIKIPAAENCILWLWVTNAHLVTGEASRILYAWGFEPKTLLTWVKGQYDIGLICRSCAIEKYALYRHYQEARSGSAELSQTKSFGAIAKAQTAQKAGNNLCEMREATLDGQYYGAVLREEMRPLIHSGEKEPGGETPIKLEGGSACGEYGIRVDLGQTAPECGKIGIHNGTPLSHGQSSAKSAIQSGISTPQERGQVGQSFRELRDSGLPATRVHAHRHIASAESDTLSTLPCCVECGQTLAQRYIIHPKVGVGDWLRGMTEHAILAVKGHPCMRGPIPGTMLVSPVGEHSRKPDEFYKLVEAHCPGPKIELFARVVREGWAQHGAELGSIK